LSYHSANGVHLHELLATMQSLYCGFFATVQTGTVQQQIVSSGGLLQFVNSASNKLSTGDNSQLLFTCKVVLHSCYVIK